MRTLLFLIFCFITCFAQGQNLVVNPGAEVNPTSVGWTLVSCHWINGSEVGAHGGSYHFFAGGASGSSCELYQDIDVTAFATSIDAGLSTFNFSAWLRSYSGGFGVWNDRGRVMVEYRNSASSVLSSYDSGLQGSTSWTQYSDSRTAPAGTRTIRIRLISAASAGSDADGYFDDVSLTHLSGLPVSLLSFDAAVTGPVIDIHWQTASEESNAFFTLEKSLDGKVWEMLAERKGLAFSQQVNHYLVVDEQPAEGLQFYRLTQTDINGTATVFSSCFAMVSNGKRNLERIAQSHG